MPQISKPSQIVKEVVTTETTKGEITVHLDITLNLNLTNDIKDEVKQEIVRMPEKIEETLVENLSKKSIFELPDIEDVEEKDLINLGKDE